MSTANDQLPVLTDAVSEESTGSTVRIPMMMTAAFDAGGENASGYDPYNSASPVVDLQNGS